MSLRSQMLYPVELLAQIVVLICFPSEKVYFREQSRTFAHKNSVAKSVAYNFGARRLVSYKISDVA